MNNEPIANRCPKCQAPLPANAPEGLCSKCLLAAVATPTEAGQPAKASAAPPSLETVAAAFPQLEILELIGSGGMGAVYKARQSRLDRFVALKLLPHPLAADPAFAERFSREARLLGRLNHPNIVTVHDFGQSGGFFYLLMEYVAGVNLRQAMAAGRFTPQQAMMLVPKICEALQFAHDEGILHRDIKPSNILLDTRGRVKIADFGIAKLLGDRTRDVTLTASGAAIGTPQYMAPEQLEHPQDVDQRADIYSLGVVFYEMLTGELPIGRFAPPSEKAAVDSRVDDVVFHALEKEREKRFRTAGEVKTSVEAITASRGNADAADKQGVAQSSGRGSTGAPVVSSRTPSSGPKAKIQAAAPSNGTAGVGVSASDSAPVIPQTFADACRARATRGLPFVIICAGIAIPLSLLMIGVVNLRSHGPGQGGKTVPFVIFASVGFVFGAIGVLVQRILKRQRLEGANLAAFLNPSPMVTVGAPENDLGAFGKQVVHEPAKPPPAKQSHPVSAAKGILYLLIYLLLCFLLMGPWISLFTGTQLRSPVPDSVGKPLAFLTLLIVIYGAVAKAKRHEGATRPGWLGLPLNVRRGLRVALALIGLALAVQFASFSSEYRSEDGRPIRRWSVGAFQPWLRKWQEYPASGIRAGTELDVATSSFACGIAALLIGWLSLRLYQLELAGRCLASATRPIVTDAAGHTARRAGFLQANSALKPGNLDAVTSDDPPEPTMIQFNQQLPPPTGPARISWLAVGSAMCSIPSWLLVISSLNNLYYSLGPDGLPPKDFTLGLFEVIVLGTGGFVGLAALFLGKEALREIHRGSGRLLGARLAIIGVLGIPTGLLVKFLPFLLAAGSRSFGWQPSSGQGELFTGAVLVGVLLLTAWAAQAVRRWAKDGAASGPATIPP